MTGPIVGQRPLPAAARGLLAAVGNTPLVELSDLAPLPAGARVFAKHEGTGPTGSIEDRAAARLWRMVHGRVAERRVVLAARGAAAIAHAQFAAAFGVPLELVVPARVGDPSLGRLRAHDARLVLIDPAAGLAAAEAEASRRAARAPDRLLDLGAEAAAAAVAAARDELADELLAQVAVACGRAPNVLVGAVGSGRTLTGLTRRLGSAVPDLDVYAVLAAEPDAVEPLATELPARIELAAARPCPVTRTVADEWSAALARRGYLAGPSSGANLATAFEAARECGGVVVTTLNDLAR